jgi:ElaB/YqjD/DUF883 family membrane-anchored ribosome-binding protein
MAHEQSKAPPDGAGHQAPDEWAEIEDLRRRIEALQDDVARADKRLRAAVRDRPFVAIGAAVLTGFVLGRVISRS